MFFPRGWLRARDRLCGRAGETSSLTTVPGGWDARRRQGGTTRSLRSGASPSTLARAQQGGSGAKPRRRAGPRRRGARTNAFPKPPQRRAGKAVGGSAPEGGRRWLPQSSIVPQPHVAGTEAPCPVTHPASMQPRRSATARRRRKGYFPLNRSTDDSRSNGKAGDG